MTQEQIPLQQNEEITPIQGYEDLYSITSFGRIWSYKRFINKHYYGVTLDGNKYWKSIIRLNSKKKHIGCFKTEIEAAKAYNKFVVENNLNKPLNIL